MWVRLHGGCQGSLQSWVAFEGRETLQLCLPGLALLRLHRLLGGMGLALKGGFGQPLGSGILCQAALGAVAFPGCQGTRHPAPQQGTVPAGEGLLSPELAAGR